jgi:hypothetical protein
VWCLHGVHIVRRFCSEEGVDFVLGYYCVRGVDECFYSAIITLVPELKIKI